jgi:uncharacterized protein involved in outer membrane biogenesis
VLPGDALLRLTGRVLPGAAGTPGPHFEGNISLAAPALRTTLAWLAKAGVTPLASLPPGVLHNATLAAQVTAGPGLLAVSDLRAVVDGSNVTGSLTLRGGKRFAFGAGLAVDRVELDPWLPAAAPGLQDVPAQFTGFDLDLRLTAKQAMLHGITFAPLALDAGAEGGRLTLRKLDLQMNGVRATASATIAEGGRVTEGRLDLQAPQAAPLAALLPERFAFLSHEAPGLWRAAAAVQVLGSGAPDSLALKVTADLDDLRLEAQPMLDLAHGTWKAGMTLRHPGAPRLLQALGVAGAPGWLGDGSLGLVAQLSGAPGRLSADSFDLTAGLFHAAGTLLLERDAAAPVLTGHIEAETLPLPLPDPRAPAPLPFDALRGLSASVQVQAARVLANLRPVLQQAAATLTLTDGVLRLDALAAIHGVGGLISIGSLDVAGEPPAAALHLVLRGATVAEPVFDLPLDLAGGKLDGAADLTTTGHAPATLLATLAGTIRLDATAGTLAGVALGKAGRLSDADVAATLAGGVTAFDRLHVDARIDRGVVTIGQGALAAPSGSATIAGSIDLPDQAIDLRIALHPALPDAPELGLRLTGTPGAMRRAPELAALTSWRATQAQEASPPKP